MKGYVHEHVYGQKCNIVGCVHCTLTMTMLYYYITYCTMQSKHGVHKHRKILPLLQTWHYVTLDNNKLLYN